MATVLITMGIMGVMGLVKGISSGVEADKNGNNYRKTVCALTKKKTQLQTTFTTLIAEGATTSTALKSTLESDLRKLNNIRSELARNKLIYDKSRNELVIISIIFVSVIAIALFFKMFGIFDLVDEAIFGK